MRFLSAILSLAIVLICAVPALAGGVSVSAQEFGPYLIREDFNQVFAGKIDRKDSQATWLNKYQVVYITVQNDSGSPINVNPGYFTLASSARKSYSFSSDMYAVKSRMPWVNTAPLQATKVLPGTSVEGFLFFARTAPKERPASLYFESGNTSGSIKVQLDPKVKQ
jgi:hypothetical protein